MKRNVDLFLSDILESIELIEKYVKGVSEADFNYDRKIQDSVIRRLEIVGEAIKNIPNSFKDKHPKIPWRKIAGLRDVLTHGYFGIQTEIIWNIIKEDILELKEKILEIKG